MTYHSIINLTTHQTQCFAFKGQCFQYNHTLLIIITSNVEHAPSWSVAVSTRCFQCSWSWVYFHAELRPRLRGWRSASRVSSQVWRGCPAGWASPILGQPSDWDFECSSDVKWRTYSVSKKNPPCGFLKFFPKQLGIFNQFLHTYYTIISTLEYKFLFKYLQLWQSYAILSAST